MSGQDIAFQDTATADSSGGEASSHLGASVGVPKKRESSLSAYENGGGNGKMSGAASGRESWLFYLRLRNFWPEILKALGEMALFYACIGASWQNSTFKGRIPNWKFLPKINVYRELKYIIYTYNKNETVNLCGSITTKPLDKS